MLQLFTFFFFRFLLILEAVKLVLISFSVPMSSSRCNFMRIKAAGLTDTYDEEVPNVKEEVECEQICVEREEVSDPCRLFRLFSFQILLQLAKVL